MAEDRAKVRIRLPGYFFLVFTIIFSTYNIFNGKKNTALIVLSTLGSIFLIFLTTRILIISAYLVQLLIIVKSKSKGLVFLAIAGLTLVPIAPIIIKSIDPNLINNLVEKSQNDKGKAKDYIRIRAFYYFLDNLKKEPITFFTGNGTATGGKIFLSKYSKKTNNEKASGFFLDDLGQFGGYYRYGLLYVLFIFIILYKIWKVFKRREIKTLLNRKDNRNIGYLKYWFIFLFLMSVTIPVFVSDADAIITICISFYILDLSISQSARLERKVIYEQAKVPDCSSIDKL